MDIETPRLRLVAFTNAHVDALERGRSDLATMVGVTLPDGWPHFHEAYESDEMRRLMSEVEADGSPWGPYLFLSLDGTQLIGSGGYKGPPRDGGVEVGYEVAPEFMNRGYATEATEGLVKEALARPEVEFLLAHTLAEKNPSTSVLEKAGFAFNGELNDPDDGPIWRWTRPRPGRD